MCLMSSTSNSSSLHALNVKYYYTYTLHIYREMQKPKCLLGLFLKLTSLRPQAASGCLSLSLGFCCLVALSCNSTVWTRRQAESSCLHPRCLHPLLPLAQQAGGLSVFQEGLSMHLSPSPGSGGVRAFRHPPQLLD